jgi:hypothetical protein
MNSFEFMYGKDWYKYEDGHIKKKYGFDFYDYFCPVLVDLKDRLDDLSADQLHSIMCAILHGYFYGVGEGKKEKIREFKRALNLD